MTISAHHARIRDVPVGDRGSDTVPPVPQAWSSWNYFAFKINETIALEIGDARERNDPR